MTLNKLELNILIDALSKGQPLTEDSNALRIRLENYLAKITS